MNSASADLTARRSSNFYKVIIEPWRAVIGGNYRNWIEQQRGGPGRARC
jgi:hypothetical protein